MPGTSGYRSESLYPTKIMPGTSVNPNGRGHRTKKWLWPSVCATETWTRIRYKANALYITVYFATGSLVYPTPMLRGAVPCRSISQGAPYAALSIPCYSSTIDAEIVHTLSALHNPRAGAIRRPNECTPGRVGQTARSWGVCAHQGGSLMPASLYCRRNWRWLNGRRRRALLLGREAAQASSMVSRGVRLRSRERHGIVQLAK